jgi:hypothetical protein
LGTKSVPSKSGAEGNVGPSDFLAAGFPGCRGSVLAEATREILPRRILILDETFPPFNSDTIVNRVLRHDRSMGFNALIEAVS